MSFFIRCVDCGYETVYHPLANNCPKCNSQWREAVYNLEDAAKKMAEELPKRRFDLWRYREVLPISKPMPELRMGEGGTPLIRAVNMGLMLGNPTYLSKMNARGQLLLSRIDKLP